MNCTHHWQPLYLQPPKSGRFLEIWDSLNLSSWQQCELCQQLGRIQANGSVKLQPAKARSALRSSASLSRRLADAHKWNDSVQTYRQNLESHL